MEEIPAKIKDPGTEPGIPFLLELLGYKPHSHTGPELTYKGVLNINATRPSFVVNKELNVWYDHSARKGGNIVDFAMAYWNLTFLEALTRIGETVNTGTTGRSQPLTARRRHAVKLPHYQVEEIRPLGNNPLLTNYLMSRGIWETAQTTLSEVCYYIIDQSGVRKPFAAAGWQNELGCWEVDSPYFKGSLGHKAITFIGRDRRTLAIFEGCFNYLSWLADNPLAADSILIINAPNLLQSAIRKARDFQSIRFYFNRDDIGRLRSAEVIKVLSQAVDGSAIYKGYGNYNEMLIKRLIQA